MDNGYEQKKIMKTKRLYANTRTYESLVGKSAF